jgi:hypothetical protein
MSPCPYPDAAENLLIRVSCDTEFGENLGKLQEGSENKGESGLSTG